MLSNTTHLTPVAKRRVAVRTALVTFGVNILAIVGNFIFVLILGMTPQLADLYVPAILATVITLPIVSALVFKMEQLHMANLRLHELATTDGMTGALNRAAFTKRVEDRLAFCARYNTPAIGALLIVDADHFKSINDRFGHQVGDDALCRISDALQSVLRRYDFFGRLGGEEFGIFLVDAPQSMAIEIAERCRAAVAAIQFSPEGKPIQLAVSIGVGMASDEGTLTSLFRDADRKLYRAKADGRNRVAWQLPHIEKDEPFSQDADEQDADRKLLRIAGDTAEARSA